MSEEILIIKHIELEGPGSIEEFFSETAGSLRVIDLSRESLTSKDFTEVAAIISLGGPMNVYEEEKYPFETTPSMVESWIKEYLDSGEQSKIINAQKMLIDTYKKNNQFTRCTNKLLLNFSRLIAVKTAI